MKKIFTAIFITTIGLIFFMINVQSIMALETDQYEFTLEEITVTAQKREENQQKVPIAMEIMTGDQISELGRNDIESILSNMSNVIINRSPDGLRISLRGVSDDQPLGMGQIQGSTPTVSLNVDSVYTDRKDGGLSLYDVERVEVLFGPQSTLYASNTPGGIVNVITGQPKIDEYEASGTIEFGNYDTLRTEGVLNAPISEKIALRTAFTTSVHDGYLSNGGDDEDLKSARLKALYKPNDRLSFIIAGEFTTSIGQGMTGVDLFVDQDDVDDPWDTDRELSYSDSTKKQKKVYGSMDWDLGFGTFSMVPSYSTHTAVNTQLQEGESEDDEDEILIRDGDGSEKAIEIRMASSPEYKIEWITGFNYYKREDNSLEHSNIEWRHSERHSNQKTIALYGNVTYPVTDQFRATVGLRQSWDETLTDNLEVRYNQGTGEIEEEIEYIPTEYNSPDYKLGVEYDLGENSMFYASWATSYRSQGLKFDADDNPYPAEELKAYTIGSKNQFFNKKLQVNASAYYYDYKNYVPEMQGLDAWIDVNNDGIETRDENFMDPGGAVPCDFRSIGVDIQTNMIITSKDLLNVSISYLKAVFPDLKVVYYYEVNEPYNIEGERDKTFSPRWTLNASYSHRFDLWNNGSVTARFDARYQTKYNIIFADTYSDVDYSEIKVQEAHYIADFSAIYASPDGKWTFTGYVNNLTNYAEKRNIMGLGQNDGYLMIGEPRTYGAILTIKY